MPKAAVTSSWLFSHWSDKNVSGDMIASEVRNDALFPLMCVVLCLCVSVCVVHIHMSVPMYEPI